jgi:hypothetical protein
MMKGYVARMQKILGEMDQVKALAGVLSRCPQVTRYDSGTEREAWTLALALSDIEESVERIYVEQVPKLLETEITPAEIYETLLSLGEELRHILYHIRDPQFYRYLEPPAEA